MPGPGKYKHSKRKDLLVASDLQKALVEVVGKCLADLVTVNAQGEKVTGYNGFEQRLPVQQDADDNPDQFFPYYIVRLLEGNTEEEEDPWTWSVAIYLGVHDEETDNAGHYQLLNAMTRITTRFGQEATMGKPGYAGFRCLPQMRMQLQDEDTYPYFLGAVLLQFAVPKVEREDPLDAYKDYDDGYNRHGRIEDQDD